MKTYLTTVSRTLDPAGKALVTVVGQHDHKFSDADVNLIQDLQDQKRASLLEFTTSGGLSFSPFQFNPFSPNTFFIPTFDVLFNGEVIHIGGQQSADPNLNRVILPPPAFWAPGTPDEDARVYVVFLELWYQSLDSELGLGYHTDPSTGSLFYFPFGGVLPDASVATSIPNDVLDPLSDDGIPTTQRAQIQWRISVARVPLTYNFKKHPFGLEFDSVAGGSQVQAQAGQASPIPGTSYQFVNLGALTGDTAVWRAGVSPNTSSSLGTMDGFSYAMPLAVCFQRNTGVFDLQNNVFGCADAATPGSGVLSSRTSGRFDFKLADQISPGDVVDTRSTVKLDGWNLDEIMREGWSDLVIGQTRMALGRGESPGNKQEALGSTLAYTVAMSPTPITNTDTVGKFFALNVAGTNLNSGFANGFSADQRTFKTAILVTTSQKSVGIQGSPWVKNDAVTITIPTAAGAKFDSVEVTAIVNNTATGTKSPAALLQGQVNITVGTTSATITFINDLSNTGFDPGANPLSIVVGVTFGAGTGVDLRKIPIAVDGGFLRDAASGKQLPVFGVSEYAVQQDQAVLDATRMPAINPEYSDIVFGVKIWLAIPGNDSRLVQQTAGGVPVTVLTLTRTNLNGPVDGLYVTRAWDLATGVFYSISARSMKNNTSTCTIQGVVPTNTTLMVSVLAQDTCQVAFNAPVKAITAIEETVLLGNYTTDNLFPMDPRVQVMSIGFDSVAQASTVVLAANGCTIEGAAGDDISRFIWVLDNAGNLNANPITRANIAAGVATVVVPSLDLRTAKFFIVGAINPALNVSSQLVVEIEYLPYQGEGVLNRNYEFLHAEDNALITTNGTGAAPVTGLSDVFPYNRELPIVASMPAQLGWNDATMINEPIASFFDSNFVGMRQNNVEHTFLVPLHTLDFIPPVNRDIRKVVQFTTTAGRGFAKATPHIGFGITGLTPRTVLGQNLQATISPIQLFVNNASGNDSNSGLDVLHAKRSVSSALSELPPVLRHPCVISLVDTGVPYRIADVTATMETIALGDGDLRPQKQYALGNLSRVIQDAGRLVISRQTGATDVVVIDATGFSGFGDGPTAAFYLDTTRVILNGLRFVGFINPAIQAYNSDIAFVDCEWQGNVQAGSFIGCDVVNFDRGTTTLPDSGVGHVCVQSNLTASAHNLIVAQGAGNTSAFFVGSRNSTLNLQKHGTGTLEETNISATTPVAAVELNSSISVTADYQSNGTCTLKANSTLSRTVVIDPFLGFNPAIDQDSSSSVVNDLG
jgi:hypothetical protein